MPSVFWPAVENTLQLRHMCSAADQVSIYSAWQQLQLVLFLTGFGCTCCLCCILSHAAACHRAVYGCDVVIFWNSIVTCIAGQDCSVCSLSSHAANTLDLLYPELLLSDGQVSQHDLALFCAVHVVTAGPLLMKFT
jgi:hypothetical protein